APEVEGACRRRRGERRSARVRRRKRRDRRARPTPFGAGAARPFAASLEKTHPPVDPAESAALRRASFRRRGYQNPRFLTAVHRKSQPAGPAPAAARLGEDMRHTERVREILSWYPSDNPGTLSNLARIMMTGRLAGTGKFVILPVDQGFEHGPMRSFAPNPAGYDPEYHYQLALEAGCNAYAAPLGQLEAVAGKFCGEVPLILKLNNSDLMYKGDDPIPAVTGSVEDALRLGCSAIGFTIYPGSAARK